MVKWAVRCGWQNEFYQVEYIGVKMRYKEAKSWEYDINFMRYQALNYLAIRNILDPMHSKVG